jgi:hypothetical protein
MEKIEVFIQNEKILEYTFIPDPVRFAEVYTALKTLWPDAVVQFRKKEKKDVPKI